MRLTPVNVTVGRDRGLVEFATDNTAKVKLSCDASEAREFIDKINVPLDVTFSKAKEAPARAN